MDGLETFAIFLVAHRSQLESSAIPRHFWEALYQKLKHQILDAGSFFNLAAVDYGENSRGHRDPPFKLFVAAEGGISTQDPESIFLIDHAWTYDIANAKQNLQQVPGLLERMAHLMGISDNGSDDEKIELVLSEMWRHNQYFAVNAASLEERMPVWYIMDEVGSAINHSDEPNFRAVPFLHLSDGLTYTLIFPIKNVEYEEEVTRDFVEGLTNDPEKREALLLPWVNSDFSAKSFAQSEPTGDYFLAVHIAESLPVDDVKNTELKSQAKIKVFTEYGLVSEYLTDEAFELVETESEADILWLMRHFKDYEELSLYAPGKFVNQFPFEHVLTIKDLLAVVCRRKSGEQKYDPETLETYPKWLPTTYNLRTEIVEFVAYYRQRKIRDLDNHWICKPWNLARGLDTHVTFNLNQILRLAGTEPKIVQKYIENPVLFERPEVGRVKFDIRYVVLLKSVEPLKVYAYGNFFLRFANKPFALNNFYDYEQHFTVMNYADSSRLCHVKCAEFVEQWNKLYPHFEWAERVQPKIFKMLREVFEAAAAKEPPRGLAKNSQSRALYAVDLMLRWWDQEMEPAILEVNYAPDNKRACEYYPDFYNDVFKCLFLDEVDSDVFHELHETATENCK